MAQLKNTTISDTGSLNLPAGTTAQRPASPVAGQIRYNTTISDTEYYDGAAWRPISDSNPEATGGTIVDTDIGGVPYRIHLFTTTGNSTFTVSKGGEVEYLIVAGGGGGGNHGGGGGGAGGLLTGTTTVTAQAYTITVGAGGTGDTISYSGSQNGGNSIFAGLTAIGGGRGNHSGAGASGGSGAGGGYGYVGAPVGGGAAGGAGTAGQGNAGGIGSGITGSYPGGGGGGAGSIGQNATDTAGGNGGHGLAVSITGDLRFYAGGGGGGTRGGVHGLGGLGGGADSPNNNAAPNTGGGGTSTTFTSSTITNRGVGGSGIVVVRYRRNASTATNPSRSSIATLPNTFSIIENGLINYIDPASPVSYPGSGTTVFSVVGDTNGTLTNNDISWTANAPGRVPAFQTFGTITAGITYGKPSPARFNLGSNAPFSIAVWVYILNFFDVYSNAIFSKNNAIGGGGPYAMLHTVGRAGNNTRGGLTSYSGNGTWFRLDTDDGIGIGEWRFCTWAYDGTTMRHYVDATEVGSFAYTWPDSSDRTVHFMSNWSSSHQFNGYMGQHLMYRRALTLSEIQALFNTTRSRYGV